ncbi:hypothetical protein EYF80_003544 [Liparis tanakae]|uniref:Uncharacterized protein n=1 Tax=Liparis tanakae TaxID=230148 RepID=A0A4Z2J7Y4_9TELE|nr:hypothetical protein EYF80_003544 [Liparis tanakae]
MTLGFELLTSLQRPSVITWTVLRSPQFEVLPSPSEESSSEEARGTASSLAAIHHIRCHRASRPPAPAAEMYECNMNTKGLR